VNQSTPIRLPLLSRFAERYGEPGVLGNTATILALHQTGDFVALLRALLVLGLNPSLTWLLDIPYSSHERSRLAIEALGFPAEHFADPLPPSRSGEYESFQRGRAIRLCERAFRDVTAQCIGNVLVLDDGGNSALAHEVIERGVSGRRLRLAIVEQTVRGVRLHRSTWQENSVYLVDVAHSAAKRRFEAPVIATTVLRETRSILREEHLELEPDDEILVIGRGAIGGAIGELLTGADGLGEKRNVVVRPGPDEQYCRLRRGRLSPIEAEEWAGRVRIVFGCTGTSSFRNEHVRFLRDRSLLVSASSWDVEFPKNNWDALGYRMNPGSPLHATCRYALDDRTVLIANSGFPVNFRGKVNSSPPEAMQLTVTLMLAGALQCCRGGVPGWYSLCPDVEEWIVGNYREIQERGLPVGYVE
jgi:adenosylhomocysteinase